MKFCTVLAYNHPREFVALARAAEEAGFDSVALADHVVWPSTRTTPYPYTEDGEPRWQRETPWADPFVSVGAMAAVTERLRFLTSIFVLPMRHPVLAAKTIATASVISGGRLVLGVGAGWMREEFELVGAEFRRRGRRMEEMVELMRKLWTGDAIEHHGEFYDLAPVSMSPAPEGEIPIWCGGTSAVALERAARIGDGWISEVQTSAEMPALLKTLREHRADSPRAEHPFSVCAAVVDAATPDAWRHLEEQGVTHIMTVPWIFYGAAQTLEQKCDGLRRFGDENIPR